MAKPPFLLPRRSVYAWVLFTVILAAALIASVTRERNWRRSFEQTQRAQQEQQRMDEAWLRGADSRLPDLTLKLRNGGCLDPRRLPVPWKAAVPWTPPNTLSPQGLEISAPAAAVDVRPYERSGFGGSFEGRPHDGKVHVRVGAFVHPTETLGYWQVTSPPKYEHNLRSGIAQRDVIWTDARGWEAARLGGKIYGYVDRRRLSQCRDYDVEIRCAVVSPDQQVAFGVTLDSAERVRLPATLERIMAVVEAMRRPCEP